MALFKKKPKPEMLALSEPKSTLKEKQKLANVAARLTPWIPSTERSSYDKVLEVKLGSEIFIPHDFNLKESQSFFLQSYVYEKEKGEEFLRISSSKSFCKKLSEYDKAKIMQSDCKNAFNHIAQLDGLVAARSLHAKDISQEFSILYAEERNKSFENYLKSLDLSSGSNRNVVFWYGKKLKTTGEYAPALRCESFDRMDETDGSFTTLAYDEATQRSHEKKYYFNKILAYEEGPLRATIAWVEYRFIPVENGTLLQRFNHYKDIKPPGFEGLWETETPAVKEIPKNETRVYSPPMEETQGNVNKYAPPMETINIYAPPMETIERSATPFGLDKMPSPLVAATKTESSQAQTLKSEDLFIAGARLTLELPDGGKLTMKIEDFTPATKKLN